MVIRMAGEYIVIRGPVKWLQWLWRLLWRRSNPGPPNPYSNELVPVGGGPRPRAGAAVLPEPLPPRHLDLRGKNRPR